MTDKPGENWDYAERFIPEDEATERAREAAAELGCVPVLPGAAAALRVLTAALGARSVVELGTGAGVSTVALLQGLAADGIVTTIDIEPEHHRAAKQTIAAAGFGVDRVRFIAGAALDVLPRLADTSYDLVLVDAVKSEYGEYVEHARRLLRVGGMVVIDNALWHSRVADPTQRDPDTTAIRETLKGMRADDGWMCALLNVGDGLMTAIKR